MKQIILLILFSGIVLCAQAQMSKFLKYDAEYPYWSLYDHRSKDTIVDVWENASRADEDPVSSSYFYGNKNLMEGNPAFEAHRQVWLNSLKRKSYVKMLESLKKEPLVWQPATFRVKVFFDKDGQVYTSMCSISKKIYDCLPKGWLKTVFTEVKKERVNPADYWDFNLPKKLGVRLDFLLGCLEIDLYELLFDEEILPQDLGDYDDRQRDVWYLRQGRDPEEMRKRIERRKKIREEAGGAVFIDYFD